MGVCVFASALCGTVRAALKDVDGQEGERERDVAGGWMSRCDVR